jgi:hypothetical protein
MNLDKLYSFLAGRSELRESREQFGEKVVPPQMKKLRL